MLHSFIMAHSFLLCLYPFTDISCKAKERIINMMELHKDAIQLLLCVLAHGFKFCIVAFFLSLFQREVDSLWSNSLDSMI